MAEQRKPAVGFPALLVVAGAGLLAYNFGLHTWSPLLAVMALWPLVLVAIGPPLGSPRDQSGGPLSPPDANSGIPLPRMVRVPMGEE